MASVKTLKREMAASVRRNRKRVEIPFLIDRGDAITAYARIEESLCYLFQVLTRTEPEIAAIIFWRIVNTSFRNQMVQKLVEARYGKRFIDFVPSLIALLRKCDEERNKIIHWTTSLELDESSSFQAYMVLGPPDVPPDNRKQRGLTSKFLKEFKRKCDFVSGMIWAFAAYIQAERTGIGHVTAAMVASDPELEPLRRKFRERVSYPPRCTHPLSPKRKARRKRPHGSQ